ncbi:MULTISPECIES: hypothetical protein [unclassified Caballeronia]|uniref:hypothetical protein n=1 Tax=unclassified Caballeronia TaxID=2646786 RepID=UPI002027CB91|nr:MULTISPECIES: hypothetical protein [unclassified Caballeronia]
MNLEDEEKALRKANDDIVEADRRILAQQERLKELERDGHDTAVGFALLYTMREARKAMEGHRDQIIEAIDLYKKGILKGTD